MAEPDTEPEAAAAPAAAAPAAAPQRATQKSSEADVNNVNLWMRAQPWYQQYFAERGLDPNRVKLSDRDQKGLMQVAAQNGVEMGPRMKIDQAGNVNQQGGWAGMPPWAKTAIIAGAGIASGGALSALGAFGGVGGGLLGGGGGAAGGGAGGSSGLVSGLVGSTAPSWGQRGLQAGIGAIQGAQGGGGWQGALRGAGTGALGAGFGGIGNVAGRTALNAGVGAAQGGLGGGGVRGILSGAAGGAAGGFAPGANSSAATRTLFNTGVNAGQGAIQGGGRGALSGAVGGAANSMSSYLPTNTQGGGGQGGQGGSMDWRTPLFNTGLNFATNYATQRAGGGGGQQQPGGNLSTGTGNPYILNATGGGNGGYTPPGIPGPNQPGTAPGGWTQTQGTQQGGGGNWWDRYGPAITQVGGAVAGGLASRQAEQGALKRSPEEQAAILGARGSANAQQEQAGNLFNVASSLTGQGRQWLEQPASYYKTLLSGNRAAMANAMAAPTAAITDTYRGAERNLERSGVRGAAKDVAAGELGRERASKIAGLTTGVQPYAADSLAKLGEAGLNQAGSLYGPAANMMGNAGNIYGNLVGAAYNNRTRAMEEGEKVGTQIGGLVRDTLPVLFPGNKNQGPAPPISTTGSKKAPVPTRPPVAQLPTPQQLPQSVPTTASRPIGTGMGSSPSWWRS